MVTVCRPAKAFIFYSGHPDVCTSIIIIIIKAYQIQRLGNRGWANVGAQNNNSPRGYGSPWLHPEGHLKLLQQNPWQHQHTWTPEINSPFFSGGSSPSSRNPLCLPESMLWTRMLEREIKNNCNYTSIFYIIIIIIIIFTIIIIHQFLIKYQNNK